MTTTAGKIFSADSHVSEPGDMWVQRIDKEFQFRAPRIEQRERHGKLQDFWIYEGFPPHPVGVGLGAAARARGGELFREGERGYGDALSGGWDPAERLKDQDIDGVDGEIVHTTLGFRLFWLKDPKLQRACFRTYNDWLAEYCNYSPKRLVGVPLISLYDVAEAVAELGRTQKMGLRGAMIWLSPPAPCPDYTSLEYDPFWAAAQEMNMPVILHTITGGAESRLSQSSYWDEANIVGAITGPHEAQRSLAQLILSGVLERFPTLKVQSAENGTDWLPWFVGRLNRSSRRENGFPTRLSMSPLEYFHRQVYFSYIDEPDAVGHRDLIGDDHLMFATDYPHTASTFPKSQEIVARDTASFASEVRQKLIHDNVLKVFDLPAPVLV
jgi:predicted TIM-barrel fold metal-dependent hydrolase